jgi:hypothetical protein
MKSLDYDFVENSIRHGWKIQKKSDEELDW